MTDFIAHDRRSGARPRSRTISALAALQLVAAGSLLFGCRSEESGSSASDPDGGSAATVAAAPVAVEPPPAPPPAPPAAPMHRLESNDGRYVILYRTNPSPIPILERFSVDVEIQAADGTPIPSTDADLVVDAAMPGHGHGMNVVPQMIKHNDGSFTATGMLFHMPGEWELYFDVTRGGTTERAQDEIELD